MDLGKQLSVHKGRLAAGGIAWYIGGLLFCAALYGAGNALVHGSFKDIPGMLLLMSIVGAWLFYNFTRWRQYITLYENGFVWTRVVRKPITVLWTDVQSVQTTRTGGGNKSIHLKGIEIDVEVTLRSGKRVVISNDMEDIELVASYAGAPVRGNASVVSPWGIA